MELTDLDIYSQLSTESQTLMQAHAKLVNIESNMELFSQGDVCNDILFLLSGTVRVFRLHESGQEITLYFLERGEQCNVNLNSAFTHTPAIGTAITQTPIQGYLLNAELTRQIYQNDPIYQQYVFSLFALRLESLAALVEDVRFKKLDHRLLDWLHEQNSMTIKITHEKLASHLGTSREVVSRLLKEFEHNNIVSLHRGSIEIL